MQCLYFHLCAEGTGGLAVEQDVRAPDLLLELLLETEPCHNCGAFGLLYLWRRGFFTLTLRFVFRKDAALEICLGLFSSMEIHYAASSVAKA